MIPLQDLNPTRRLPVVNYALIFLNVLVFLWEQSMTDAQLQRVFLQDSVVPALVIVAPWNTRSQAARKAIELSKSGAIGR